VEFDELDLGVCGQDRRRSFFPDHPERAKWVPIFHRESWASGEEDTVSRTQFPLVLAYALTHWKAQGMTLGKVRVRMGQRGAVSVGVGYVVATRVKHYRDLFLETPLPDWDVFQKVKLTPEFRFRLRFELRLAAKFSRTLRRHKFCECDVWTDEQSDAAARLLRRLEDRGKMQREAVTGRVPRGEDAWLWPGEQPCLREFVDREALLLVREDGFDRDLVGLVADRLLSELHEPAVREALGCLIPAHLHPSLVAK
jgi:hypothetical protein